MAGQPSYHGDIALLGLREDCTLEDAKAAFRSKALETHPDRGGRAEDFRAIKAAYDRLIAFIPKREAIRQEQQRQRSQSFEFGPGVIWQGFDWTNSTSTASTWGATNA